MLSRLQRAVGPPLQRLACVRLPDRARGRVPASVVERLPAPLRRRVAGAEAPPWAHGRLPSLGQDADVGHRSYVASLDEAGVRWLHTKPFSAPANYELARCLYSFGHIIEGLSLPESAQIVDVGCGPGWMSEWLARCGFHVTGIDVSEDMIVIARERLDRVPTVDDAQPTPQAEFHVMASHDLPFEDRFDAAILYDAMHHFTDERASLAAIHRALIPGGRIYIHEGVRPPTGSAGERELIEEMERYGTLESPFDPAYLVQLLEEAGFENIHRFIEADTLIDLDAARSDIRRLRDLARAPETNTIIARKPIPADASPGRLAARFGIREARREGDDVAVEMSVTNNGTAFWTAAGNYPFPVGTITVAPFVLQPDGSRRELDRVALPRSMRSGESADLSFVVQAGDLAGNPMFYVDLVAEGVCWFAERGSEALGVPVGAS